MIESNVGSQASASLRQAQGQDVRTQQAQQEANASAVAEQASSQPVASSGAEAGNNVSSQPSDVVTRLGETPDEVPLYESGRPNGSIIRPSIELAQNAENAEQASAQRNADENRSVERNADDQAARQANEGSSPARGNDPSPDDVQDMV